MRDLKLVDTVGGRGDLSSIQPRLHCSNFSLERTVARSGFTLAEVLITLGVIGVVAAITMPTINAKIKEKALESALKKAEYSLVNGYKLMMSKESVFKVANLPFMSCYKSASCISPWHKKTFNVVDDNVSGLTSKAMPKEYLLGSEYEDGYNTISPFSWDNVPYLFRTADGMTYGVEVEDGYETFSVYADINGKKIPNTVCKDMQKFRISGIGLISNVCGELANTNNNGCSLSNPTACEPGSCMALQPKDRDDSLSYDNQAIGYWENGHYKVTYCYGDSSGNSDSNFVEDWCVWNQQQGNQDQVSLYCR